ncbi:MAG: D-glycero-beta-D-manno-heptose 1,7-bisphosphate 7-phosphatase [Gammaproteobacteria bacterium]|nr:D-glycero-beta-D-manno-heptose 1,7-bisphosphate 7-phosphatase [Gammaproteobacteria bacterium]
MPVQPGITPGGSPIPRLVILGRDGVINERRPSGVRTVDEWKAISGSLRAIARLTSAQFHLVVATNQPGIAGGALDGGILAHIHAKMNSDIAREGGRIEAIFYCPHGVDDKCSCRKPRPGLLLEVAKRLDVDMDGVPFIGDTSDDIEAARAAGARPILLRTGRGLETEKSCAGCADVEVYNDLADAASALIDLREAD